MDFKIIWHNCSPSCVNVPFVTFVQVSQRSSSCKLNKLSFWAIPPFSTLFSQSVFFNGLKWVYLEERVRCEFFSIYHLCDSFLLFFARRSQMMRIEKLGKNRREFRKASVRGRKRFNDHCQIPCVRGTRKGNNTRKMKPYSCSMLSWLIW